MSRPSLPPDEARDWNKVLARIENLENKVRVLASQDTPTKFGDLDDVDTIFAADLSVATFVAETGKIEMRPASGGGGTGNYDWFVDLTGVTYPGSQYPMEWKPVVSPFTSAGFIVPDTDGSGNFVGRATAAGFYVIAGGALQWPAGAAIDAEFLFVFEVFRSGLPIAASTISKAYSFATNSFNTTAGSSVLGMRLQAGDFVYAIVEANGPGTEKYALQATVAAIT